VEILGVMWRGYLFCIFLFNQLSAVFPLAWSGVATAGIFNGGDIVTYGSFSTLAQGNGRNVRIYYQEYTGNIPYWSYGATLVANLTKGSHSYKVDLGFSLSAGKGLLPLDILFAGAPKNNSVFVFQDTRLHWTQQQILQSPDSEALDQFGYDVAVDVLNPNRAVVSAPYDDDNGLSSGSAYVFLSTPTGTQWTLTQKLRSDYISPYGLYGEEVVIFENKIIVTAPGDCKVYLYSEQKNPQGPFWTQQQVLTYSGCNGLLTISQYDNDLVVGVPSPSSAPTGSGSIYILESKTYRGDCDGDYMPRDIGEIDQDELHSYDELLAMKETLHERGQEFHELGPKICEATRWSQKQIFTVTSLCGYFGSNVAVYEDVIVATRLSSSGSCPLGGGTPTFLVYERNKDTGVWALSQTLTSPATYSTSGAGSNGLSLYGTSFVVGTQDNYNNVYSYTPSTASINCLKVTFADTFGDGWSGVDLLITNTEHYTERYSFYCDAVSNPRTMRYCPTNVQNYENGNTFKFEIMNAKPHPYHDEIRWYITPEESGIPIYGDMNTKMEFIFDGNDMTLIRGDDVIDQYNNCETECKANFEASSDKMVVLPITLYDSGGDTWQDDYKMGTSWVITDRYGKKVYAKGTLCTATTSQTCYVELPYDEKFAIRVDGALDSNGGQHTWLFCGMSGESLFSSSSSLSF
jgi:hypothetical protein